MQCIFIKNLGHIENIIIIIFLTREHVGNNKPKLT